MVDVRARVREFILRECLPGESAERLRDDTPLQSVLDSMSSLKLATILEQQTGIEIEARDMGSGFANVNNIVALVEKRLAAK